MIVWLVPFSPLISVNRYINLSGLESGQAPFLVPLTKRTRRLVKVHWFHNEDSHSSTSTCEEFLQDIMVENISIGEEYANHLTGIALSISKLIQANIVLAEPSLVATNK